MAAGLSGCVGLGWLTWPAAFAACAVLVVWVLILWLVRLQKQARLQRAWAQSRFANQRIDWRFSEAGVEQTGDGLRLSVPWSGFSDVALTRHGFVFTLTPTASLLLETPGLTDAQSQAVSAWVLWARQDGGPLD